MTHLPHWTIPQHALEVSFAELARDGAIDREGIALWAGVDTHDGAMPSARISHIVCLRGPGIVRHRGYIGISAELLNDVTDALANLGDSIYLIGQIHGHPPGATTDLSPTDVAYGIRTPDYLSVVAPNFGIGESCTIDGCGVHAFDPATGWTRLTTEAMQRHVHVDQAARIACVTVGDVDD